VSAGYRAGSPKRRILGGVKLHKVVDQNTKPQNETLRATCFGSYVDRKEQKL
jgi:hypothetical protein